MSRGGCVNNRRGVRRASPPGDEATVWRPGSSVTRPDSRRQLTPTRFPQKPTSSTTVGTAAGPGSAGRESAHLAKGELLAGIRVNSGRIRSVELHPSRLALYQGFRDSAASRPPAGSGLDQLPRHESVAHHSARRRLRLASCHHNTENRQHAEILGSAGVLPGLGAIARPRAVGIPRPLPLPAGRTFCCASERHQVHPRERRAESRSTKYQVTGDGGRKTEDGSDG
jgi:hypothetical protein